MCKVLHQMSRQTCRRATLTVVSWHGLISLVCWNALLRSHGTLVSSSGSQIAFVKSAVRDQASGLISVLSASFDKYCQIEAAIGR
jgi:hypothetical protein